MRVRPEIQNHLLIARIFFFFLLVYIHSRNSWNLISCQVMLLISHCECKTPFIAVNIFTSHLSNTDLGWLVVITFGIILVLYLECMLYMLNINDSLLGINVNYPCNTPSAKVHLKNLRFWKVSITSKMINFQSPHSSPNFKSFFTLGKFPSKWVMSHKQFTNLNYRSNIGKSNIVTFDLTKISDQCNKRDNSLQ